MSDSVKEFNIPTNKDLRFLENVFELAIQISAGSLKLFRKRLLGLNKTGTATEVEMLLKAKGA